MILLPSSPLSFCSDRFSLTDSDSDLVPSWSVVEAVLSPTPKTPSQLIDRLETLAVTFHNTAGSDFLHLRDFLHNTWARDAPRFFDATWPKCVQLALEMPTLFPSGSLPAMTAEQEPRQEYSRRQVACLVIHQFLCTFERPQWMLDDASPDFHIWYGSEQPHPKAVHAYLYSLFTYFNLIASESESSQLSTPPVIYTLHTAPSVPIIPPSTLLTPLTIHELAASGSGMHTHLLGLPSGACVISANQYVGFGRTGSQEEMHVGSTPEACPIVLVTPPLKTSQVLVVQGVESMIEMDGYGRDARLKTPITTTTAGNYRTMLFMDALELDSYDTSHFTPDLLPGNLNRELTKAYTAFRSGPPYNQVVTGFWGCRSFGGNHEIKALIQWCAASLAGVPLTFVVESEHVDIGTRLRNFSSIAQKESWTIYNVFSLLLALKPDDETAKDVLEYITCILTNAEREREYNYLK